MRLLRRVRLGLARLVALVALMLCGVGLSASAVATSEESAQPKSYHRPVIEAPVCAPPLIDGVLDDACWQQAYYTDDFWNTDDQCPPAERTEAWLCVDDAAFYLAAYAYDSNPAGIKCQETKRGGNIRDDDYVVIGIDTHHSGDQRYAFLATANGTQYDEIPGGSDANIEWRGDWSAAARIVDNGWILELRIPFAILRYPAGQSVWGVVVQRRHARTNTKCLWPPQPIFDLHEIAEVRGLNLPIIRVRPIVMPNIQSEWNEGHFRTNIALDTKYMHPSGLTGVMSLTPDFRNIEDEVESVDFSYTERWYSDRRPFFVEGGGYMPPGEMFYSRRIEDFDLGLKLFGTVDRTSVGLLDAYSFDGRNDMALQVRQRIAKYNEAAFGYVRTDQAESDNQTYYATGSYRKLLGRGSFDLSGRLFESHTEGGDAGTSWSVNASRWRGQGKPGFWANYRRVDPTFDPKDGFAPDTDLEGFSAGINFYDRFHNRHREANSLWMNLSFFDRTNGQRYHDDMGLGFRTSYRNGTSWNISWSHSDRPPNVDHTWGVGLGWSSKKLHQGGGLYTSWGDLGGADYLYYSASQGFKLTDKLCCNVGHEFRESDYPDDTRDYRIRRTTLTFNYDFTPEKTLGGRLLTGSQGTNFYMSYRQAVRRGTDFFVILGDPNAEDTQNRLAVKTKWVYH